MLVRETYKQKEIETKQAALLSISFAVQFSLLLRCSVTSGKASLSKKAPIGKNIEPVVIIYEYDDAGNLITMTKADNSQTLFDYDELNRIKKISYRKTVDSAVIDKIIKYYDDTTGISVNTSLSQISNIDVVLGELRNTRGRLVADLGLSNSGNCVVDLYSYNDDGKVSAKYKYIKSEYAKGLGWQKIAYNYDLIGNMVNKAVHPQYLSTGAPDSIVTKYKYDNLNRMNCLTNGNDNKIVQYSYNNTSLLNRKDYFNPTNNSLGLSVNFNYNIRDWVDNIEAKNHNNALLFNENLGYQGLYNGNIANAQYYYGDASVSRDHFNYQYNYDGVNRLTSVLADTAALSEAFAYDNIGRILQTRKGNNSLSGYTDNMYKYYSVSNRLRQVTTKHPSGLNYVYDFNGNMISDESKSMGIHYDWRDMPDSIEMRYPSSTHKASVKMIYDAAGNRVMKMESSWTTFKGVAYFDDEIEYETKNNTTNDTFQLKTAYINGEGGTESKVDVGNTGTLSYNYFIKDHLGSTRLVVGQNGQQLINANAYWSYGMKIPLFVSGNSSTLRKEFTGKEWDKDGAFSDGITSLPGMNLYYFGKRYYDPDICRWISTDPQHEFYDSYRYTTNPIAFSDIEGMSQLYFNRALNQLKLVTNSGAIYGPFPAGNNVDSRSNGQFPVGNFSFDHLQSHKGEGANSSFGNIGNFIFNVQGRTNMGVHAGRANSKDALGRKGILHCTFGCIRTTDFVISLIAYMTTDDPLTTLNVSNNVLENNSDLHTNMGVKPDWNNLLPNYNPPPNLLIFQQDYNKYDKFTTDYNTNTTDNGTRYANDGGGDTPVNAGISRDANSK